MPETDDETDSSNVLVAGSSSISFNGNPTTVAYEGSVTLNWSAEEVDSCMASGDWSGARDKSGIETIDTLTADSTFELTCSGTGDDVSASIVVTVTAAPVPTVTLSANPDNVLLNGSTNLSWSSTNATSCIASGSWSGSRSISGTLSRNNLTSDKTYTLTCSGAGGSASDSVNVTVVAPSVPIVNISANPLNVAYGGSTTLSWSSSNVDTCTASGNWSGGKSTSGTSSRANLIQDRTYTLSCSGAGGTASDTVNITVANPPPVPTLSFSASPTIVSQNGSTTLSWSSNNADDCTASGDWLGNKGTSGSETTGALTSTRQYTLDCSGAGGNVSKTVTVTYNPGNSVPIANAGVDQNVVTGSPVNLNGAGSSDADNDPLTFLWTLTSKPAGSAATLNNTTIAVPLFTADVDGQYQISLVVNDGNTSSNIDFVSVNASSTSYDCTSNTVHCVDDTSGINQEYTTIQTAVNISSPGDIVLVFDGNYAGFRVSASGTSAQRIKVLAQSTNANITSTEPFGNNAIRIENSSYITIEGFRIDGSGFSASTNYDYACIGARGASVSSPMKNLRFINNSLSDCAPAGMYLSNVRDLLISGNVIRDTRDVGGNSGMGVYIANAGAKNATIVENIISGNDDVAIHFNGDAGVGGDGLQTGHVIQRNEFDSNGSNGFSMDGVQDILVENNIFSRNAKHGVRGYQIDGSDGPKNWVIVNNTFYNNESPVKTTEDAGGHIIFNCIVANNIENVFLINTSALSSSNNIFTTSQTSIFNNVATNDLRLKTGSSPVSAGTASFMGKNAPGDDFSSAPRNGPPDVGAFELGSNYPSWYQ